MKAPLEGQFQEGQVEEEQAVEEQAVELQIFNPLASLCQELPHIASQIPYNHPSQQKSLALLEHLEMSVKFSEVIRVHGIKLYRGLGEYFNECEPLAKGFYCRSEEGARRLINFCALQARLASVGRVDAKDQAVEWFRIALEGYTDKYDAINDRCSKDAIVKAAALWILCGGQYLYNELALYPAQLEDDEISSYAPGKLYTGPILGLERWMFWQRRFAALAGQTTTLDAEACAMARKAANVMAVLATEVEW
ncbi:hypothetical protein BJX70DRAFT_355057 [Aspergillus crustosus]